MTNAPDKPNLTVAEIVVRYLQEHGYDGLYSPDGECACLIDDIGPCSAESFECEAGVRVDYRADEPCGLDCSGSDHWHIEAEGGG